MPYPLLVEWVGVAASEAEWEVAASEVVASEVAASEVAASELVCHPARRSNGLWQHFLALCMSQ